MEYSPLYTQRQEYTLSSLPTDHMNYDIASDRMQKQIQESSYLLLGQILNGLVKM